MISTAPKSVPPPATPVGAAFGWRPADSPWLAGFGLRALFVLRPSSFVLPALGLALIALLAALHNRGLPLCGALAWGACFALPLAAGAPPGASLAWPRRGRILPVVATLASLLLPTAAIAAVVHFQLGALLYHPSVADTLRWLAPQAAAAVALAAAEEFFFRGWLQQTVLARTRRPVLWSAVAFALTHVAVTGWWWLAPVWFVSGAILGWVTRRADGSLWPALLLHAAGNLAFAWGRLLVAMNLPFFSP